MKIEYWSEMNTPQCAVDLDPYFLVRIAVKRGKQ
jgi:hypothetical protein